MFANIRQVRQNDKTAHLHLAGRSDDAISVVGVGGKRVTPPGDPGSAGLATLPIEGRDEFW
jgi:hypothetical protein